jgi:hypothetical protein
MATTTFSNLKLSTAKRGAQVAPVQQRRNKMSKRLWEQIQLAKCQAEGTSYNPVKFRTVTDKETGIRRQVEMPKRVRCWWFTADNGKTAIAVRYGARTLELAKGKFAVEVASPAELVPTLELILKAVDAGELDVQLETTAGAVRSSFVR